jgi:hypothetical protein
MANDLKILITAALNKDTSIAEINKGIDQLKGKIDKLNLSIKLDNSVLNILKDFSNQMSKISDVAKNTGKIIQESINPDGSKTKTTYYNGLKGEFSQIEVAAKQSGEAQLKSFNDVLNGFSRVTSEASKYNAELVKVAETIKLVNDTGSQTRTVKMNGLGQVTGYTDTNNVAKQHQLNAQATKEEQDLIDQIEKFRLQSLQRRAQEERAWEQAQAQAINKNAELERQEIVKTQATRKAYEDWWLKSLVQQDQAQARQGQVNQQKLLSEKNNLTQSLQKMYDSGSLNEKFFDNFNKGINSAKNIEELNKLQAGLERVSQYTKNQNLQQGLLNQAHSLLGSGKIVDESGINNLISSLNRLNLSGATATRELSLMQAELNGYRASATAASEQTSTFGTVLGKTLGNLSMYFGGFMLFTQAFNALKDGISTVNELNKSLTEISIVTYQNQQQVSALGEEYNKLAQQMGVTTKDIAQEATELYRQGLSADEVTSRMKVITEYAKISSIDTKTASEIMTAAINSMGVSATRAADVWSLLGDSTATGKIVPLITVM